MIKPFNIAPTPQLYFGVGKISVLPSVIKAYGTRILLITGARSFLSSPSGSKLLSQLEAQGNNIKNYSIDKEPTPAMVGIAVEKFSSTIPNVVVAIGGGSVLDAGKAIAAMLPLNKPVKDYLEGVGSKEHPGVKVPFIAIPTTSGTGSEATKNAVLSEVGTYGYKRSLRHTNFVPDVAIVDPALTVNCPQAVTAASGMDAFTQLLESYLSTAANSITDALALDGLQCVAQSLKKVYNDGADLQARTDMALASYLSGITLANAGLGVVHGFASSIGGYTEIPHGVICSALMGASNKLTVRRLRQDNNVEFLEKYARVGKMFLCLENKSQDYYIDSLLGLIEAWTIEMNIPSLALLPSDFSKIVETTDNKNNPVRLNKDEMLEILSLTK